MTIFPEKGITYAGLSNQPVNTFAIAERVEGQVVSHYEKLEASQKTSSVAALEKPTLSHQQIIDGLDLAERPSSKPRQGYAEKLAEKGILVSKEI